MFVLIKEKEKNLQLQMVEKDNGLGKKENILMEFI